MSAKTTRISSPRPLFRGDHRDGSIRNWTEDERLQLLALHDGMNCPMTGKNIGTSW